MTSSSPRYAVVTLVMRGDRYVPGARVLARSARSHLKEENKHLLHFVCMVTADVDSNARISLANDFDVLIDVPVISGMYSKTNGIFDSKYGTWIADSFTKWNCLGFVQYERIAFFDADCLILKDISESLMDVQFHDCPAGVFSNSWSTTVLQLTPERVDKSKTPMSDPYAKHVVNGDGHKTLWMPAHELRESLDYPVDEVFGEQPSVKWTGMHFVPAGSSIFFQPIMDGAALFQSHLPRLTKANPRCGGSGPDDQAIVRFLLEYHPVHAGKQWQFLHAGWCFIPWKTSLLHSQKLTVEQDGVVQHYFNVKKPWESNRLDWPDLEDWWVVHDQLTPTSTPTPIPTPTQSTASSIFYRLLYQGTSDHAMMLDLLIRSQLRQYPRLHRQLWDRLTQLVPKHQNVPIHSDDFDERVYTALREYYHKTLLTTSRSKARESLEVGASEGRSTYRAEQVAQYLEGHNVNVLVDIGCGNGTITSAMASRLKLDPKQCVGIDVLKPVRTSHTYVQTNESCSLPFPDGCMSTVALMSLKDLVQPNTSHTYIQVNESCSLPFADGSVSTVVALMSLHHMKDLDFKLTEIARVCQKGARFVVREHDAPEDDPLFADVLEVMHGLYCRVWPAVPEALLFAPTYYAKYMSRMQWRNKMEAGSVWKRVDGTNGLDGSGVARFYFDVWEKL